MTLVEWVNKTFCLKLFHVHPTLLTLHHQNSITSAFYRNLGWDFSRALEDNRKQWKKMYSHAFSLLKGNKF